MYSYLMKNLEVKKIELFVSSCFKNYVATENVSPTSQFWMQSHSTHVHFDNLYSFLVGPATSWSLIYSSFSFRSKEAE